MIKNIRHTGILTNNLKLAIKFYKDILNFKIVERKRLKGKLITKLLTKSCYPYVDLTYVKFAINKKSSFLEVYYFHNFTTVRPADFRHIAFTVKNINKLYKKLLKNKAIVLTEPIKMNKVKLFFARDFDGNLLEFVEEL